MLSVKKLGNPVLRKISEPIETIDSNIIELAERMIHSMYENNGIGLAAPQIGTNIRMFTIDIRMSEEDVYKNPGEALLCPQMPLAIINPKILSFSEEKSGYDEGCLSIPEINAEVIRPSEITLTGTLLNGQEFTVECSNMLSRCAQHEIDHLDGILFTDRVEEEEFEPIAQDVEKLRKKTLKELKKKRKK